MPDIVLLDTDIILKTCCFGLAEELVNLITNHDQACWILGVTGFVVGKNIAKSKRINNRTQATAASERILAASVRLEPDEDEIALAAQLESHGFTDGAALDPGESLLFSVLVRRSAHLLITGDKRAIHAFSQLAKVLDIIDGAAGRLACLEQVMLALCDILGFTDVTVRVCAEPLVDQAIAICFGCAIGRFDEEESLAGLCSYIAHLRTRSGKVLTEGHADHRLRGPEERLRKAP